MLTRRRCTTRGARCTATPTRPSAARERILDTAFSLFYARGIRAVGVDLIIAESGVAKATFYKHFPARDDLVVAYLDKVDGIWTGQLKAAAQAAGAAPAAQLVGLFDALGTACRREGYRGCASSTPRPSHSRAPRSTTGRWRTRQPCSPGVRELAEQAGARDPEALARSLTLLLDGGLASGSLDASPEAPKVARACAAAMVSAATGASV